MSSRLTGVFILFNTVFTMLAAGGRPAGYDDPENGSSCPLQLVFG